MATAQTEQLTPGSPEFFADFIEKHLRENGGEIWVTNIGKSLVVNRGELSNSSELSEFGLWNMGGNRGLPLFRPKEEFEANLWAGALRLASKHGLPSQTSGAIIIRKKDLEQHPQQHPTTPSWFQRTYKQHELLCKVGFGFGCIAGAGMAMNGLAEILYDPNFLSGGLYLGFGALITLSCLVGGLYDPQSERAPFTARKGWFVGAVAGATSAAFTGIVADKASSTANATQVAGNHDLAIAMTVVAVLFALITLYCLYRCNASDQEELHTTAGVGSII